MINHNVEETVEHMEKVGSHFLTALFLLLFNQGMLAKICFSSSFSSTGSSAAEGNRHEGNHGDESGDIISCHISLGPWHTYPSHLGQRAHEAMMFVAKCGVVPLFPKWYKHGDICRQDVRIKAVTMS